MIIYFMNSSCLVLSAKVRINPLNSSGFPYAQKNGYPQKGRMVKKSVEM